jgi:hypothetical protein
MKNPQRIAVAALLALPLLHASSVSADGNLSVGLEDGVLLVVGDRLANEIVISDFDGTIFVNRLAFPWDINTTVNGGKQAEFLDSDVSEVVVIGGGGGDLVAVLGTFGDVDAHIDFMIDTGAGRDQVSIGIVPTEINGRLFVNTGLDDDRVSSFRLTVNGSADFTTGQGEDELHFGFLCQFAGDVAINTGTHGDLVTMVGGFEIGLPIDGSLSLQFGQGDDLLDLVYPLMVAGDASLSGGQGDDVLLSPSNLFVGGDSQTSFESESE